MSGRREQRRRQRRELSRAQILDAAEEVLAERGVRQASMKEIAARAEFSVGAVYSFFENKDDLLTQIFVRRGDEFMAGMRKVLAGTGTPRQQLHRLADFQIEFFRRHASFGRLFLHSSAATVDQREGEADRAVSENYVEAMALQAKLFHTGQDAGELRAGDPEVLARLFSGLVSAYQATDPAVMDDAVTATERMAVTDFHEILSVFER